MIGQSLRPSTGEFIASGAVVLASLLTAGATRADPIVQTATIASQPSDWNSSFTFDKFDPALGTLGGVALKLDADLVSTVIVESRESAPSNFSASILGNVNVTRPDNSLILSTAPSASTAASLGAFDGTVDFVGSSGRTTSGLTGSSTAATSGVLTPSDQALFTGPGSIALPVRADVRTTQQGPANLTGRLETLVGATASLTYEVGTPGNNDGGGFGSVTDGSFNANLPLLPFGAVETVPQIVEIADQTTGWITDANFQKFNPALGSLFSVNVKLTSHVTGDRAFENLGATSAFITTDQDVTITLKLLDDETLVSLLTNLTGSVNLDGFDGTADFTGLSGKTIADLIGSNMTTGQLIDHDALLAFIGYGTIALPVSSRGTSRLEGPGNMWFDIGAEAGARIELSYVYFVPEPAPLAILVLPLLGIAIARRRRPNSAAGSPLEDAAAA